MHSRTPLVVASLAVIVVTGTFVLNQTILKKAPIIQLAQVQKSLVPDVFPKIGEELYVAKTYTFTWGTLKKEDRIKILLSSNKGSVRTIAYYASGTEKPTLKKYKIPGLKPATDYQIKICTTRREEGLKSIEACQFGNVFTIKAKQAKSKSILSQKNSRVSPSNLGAAPLGGLLVETPLKRNPYVSNVTLTSVTISWQSTAGGDSTVNYGPTIAYGSMATGPSVFPSPAGGYSIHVVTINGLLPNTKYYYRASTVKASSPFNDENFYFKTAPAIGSAASFTVAIFGNSGDGGTVPLKVASQMQLRKPSLVLHTGDISYGPLSLDEVYYKTYENMMRNTPFYPVCGNGDLDVCQRIISEGSLPQAGNASGVRSTYSFDYGNAHFVALNSNESMTWNAENPNLSSPQLAWAYTDLMGTAQPWKIIYWHHNGWSLGTAVTNPTVLSGPVALAKATGSKLVFWGNTEVYERIQYPTGLPVYVAAGNGGKRGSSRCPGTFVGNSPSCVYGSKGEGGFVLATIAGNSLQLSYITESGLLADAEKYNLTSLPPNVRVISPNGGDAFEIGKTYNVSFNLTTQSPVRIYLEKYHSTGLKVGVNSSALITEFVSVEPGIRSYAYTLPDTLAISPGLGSTYKIKICTDATCSVYDNSDTFFSIVPKIVPPAIPATPAVSAGVCGGSLVISWSVIANATSYKLYRDGGLLNILPLNFNQTSFTETLAPGSAHSYVLVATNNAGDSAPSQAALGTASALCPPSISVQVPNSSSYVVKGEDLIIEWTQNYTATLLNISLFDVTDNSQAPILAYSTTYQSSPTGTNQKVISNFDFAVLAGRSYIVKICDPNVPNPQNQTPPLCGSSSIFLVDYPNYPINLTARALSGTQIRLTWEDGAGTETGARIERSLDGVTFTSAGQVGANVTTFTNSSLTANRLYFYRVIYFDADGDMFEGDVVMARTAGYALSASSINSTGSGFVEFNYVGVDRRNSEIVAAGTFEGTADFGGGTTLTSIGGGKFLARYSSAGSLIWVKNITDPLALQDETIDFDVSGNGTVAILEERDVDGGYRATIRKFNTDGTLAWQKDTSLETETTLSGVALDSAGNVVVSGTTSPVDACSIALVRKHAGATGNVLWEKLTPGTTNVPDACVSSAALDIVVDSADGVIFTGTAEYETAAVYRTDLLTVKYNSAGTLSWKKTAVSTDAISGYAEGLHILINRTNNSTIITGKIESDNYILSYNSAGALSYKKLFPLDTVDTYYFRGSVNSSGSIAFVGEDDLLELSSTATLLWSKVADATFGATSITFIPFSVSASGANFVSVGALVSGTLNFEGIRLSNQNPGTQYIATFAP